MAPALFHATWGSGPLTLALHGLGASSAYWDLVARHLPSRRLVAPDLLGFGRSPAPAGSAYDLDAQLEGVGRVLVEPATIVGHSTGCLVALGAAARWPHLVRHLVLTALPAWPDAATAAVEVGRLGAMARWTATGDRRGRMICELMCRHAALAAMVAPLAVRSVPPTVAIDGVRHTWTSYHRTLANLVLAESAADLLSRVTCPVTTLVGTHDRTTLPGWATRLAVEQPSLGLVLLDGVDHHPALRVPERVAAAVGPGGEAGS